MPTREEQYQAKERHRLATEEGKYRCMGRCKQVKPLSEGLVTYWGGNVLFSICPECFSGTPVVMKETTLRSGGRGIWVGPLHKIEETPRSILPVSSMDDVKDLVPENTLSKFKKEEEE